MTTEGFGKSMPVVDYWARANRQKNRRVEIVVSGEEIGVKIHRSLRKLVGSSVIQRLA